MGENFGIIAARLWLRLKGPFAGGHVMYLNIIQLAESFGVEESVVENWVRKDGLPAIEDRNRFLFDRNQVVDWAAARGLAAKAGFLAAVRPASATNCRLEPLLCAGGIWRDVPAAKVGEVMETIVAKLPGATPPIRQLLAQRLRQAGGISWAAVGNGLALPHLRTPIALGRDAGAFAILMLREALLLTEPAPDDVPVTRLLFFIAPSPRAHLELLSLLSSALLRGGFQKPVMDGASDEQIFSALIAAEASAAQRKEDK
jgi:nitrogen PTS system EIIA component